MTVYEYEFYGADGAVIDALRYYAKVPTKAHRAACDHAEEIHADSYEWVNDPFADEEEGE